MGDAVTDGVQVGEGDNVFQSDHNVRGTLRYVRSVAQVLDLMDDGVPPQTIALIDDSGGTLTAPIVGEFTGVICRGGTVRSHLGIITREFNVPCLMNASVDETLKDGDTVEVEYAAEATSAEEYHGEGGKNVRARIWKVS